MKWLVKLFCLTWGIFVIIFYLGINAEYSSTLSFSYGRSPIAQFYLHLTHLYFAVGLPLILFLLVFGTFIGFNFSKYQRPLNMAIFIQIIVMLPDFFYWIMVASLARMNVYYQCSLGLYLPFIVLLLVLKKLKFIEHKRSLLESNQD